MRLIEYENANAEVRAVYDDFLAVRKTDWINNFWKAIAYHPSTLRRTWERIKEVMAPGALDLVTKQMIYVAAALPIIAAMAWPRTSRPGAPPA